jgi:hypothetical protein
MRREMLAAEMRITSHHALGFPVLRNYWHCAVKRGFSTNAYALAGAVASKYS